MGQGLSERACPSGRALTVCFPRLSPDEESSQKFIPFVGVSTAQAGSALRKALLPPGWLHLLPGDRLSAKRSSIITLFLH